MIRQIACPTAEEAVILKSKAAQLQELLNKTCLEQWPAYKAAQPLTVKLACGLITTPVQRLGLTKVPVAISKAPNSAQGKCSAGACGSLCLREYRGHHIYVGHIKGLRTAS